MKMTAREAKEHTRDFLYEWSGGMEENEERDRFLDIVEALLAVDDTKEEKILGHLLRAAFFQGKAVGIGSQR